MKYANARIPNKCYYISKTLNGGFEVKEHRNGVFATSLFMSYNEYVNFIALLENNGWTME